MPTPVRLLGGLLPVLLLAATPPVEAGARRFPRYVSFVLAGQDLWGGHDDVVRDRNTGYYVRRYISCCGGPHGLLLTPRERAHGEFAAVDANSVTQRSLKLATGRGVNIGDQPADLREKLGLPTRARLTSGTVKRRVYTYVYRYRDGEALMEYQADYTFHNDRLWSIEYSLDFLEGG